MNRTFGFLSSVNPVNENARDRMASMDFGECMWFSYVVFIVGQLAGELAGYLILLLVCRKYEVCRDKSDGASKTQEYRYPLEVESHSESKDRSNRKSDSRKTDTRVSHSLFSFIDLLENEEEDD